MPFVSGQPWDFPGIGIIVLVVAFYLSGLLISRHYGRRLLSGLSAILLHVPLVKVIFGVTQQATTALVVSQLWNQKGKGGEVWIGRLGF